MNKKYLFLILAVLTLNAAVFTACSDEKEESFAAEDNTNNYTAAASDTTVTGEVTAISGNYVTLALGTVKESSEASENTEQDGEARGFDGKMPEMNGDMPEMDGDFSKMDGERPGMNGEMPEMNGDMSEMSGGHFGANGSYGGRKSSASIEKSGEEYSCTLPVGMNIDGLSGRSSDYSAVTVGTVLTLTISEDGVVRAAKAD